DLPQPHPAAGRAADRGGGGRTGPRARQIEPRRGADANPARAALAAPPVAAAPAHGHAARERSDGKFAPGYCARAAEDFPGVVTPQLARSTGAPPAMPRYSVHSFSSTRASRGCGGDLSKRPTARGPAL